MKDTISFIKRLLGKYEVGYEYWVNTKDIIVPDYYKKISANSKKWKHKLDYWQKTGNFKLPIKINKDFVLVDGFSSVKIAYLNNIEKVPVYFIN